MHGMLHVLCILLFFYISHTLAVEYELLQDVYLKAERIQEYKLMPIKLCINECEKRTNCISVNFDKEHFNCSLYDTSYLQSDKDLVSNTKYTYAFLKKKTMDCVGCESYESCVVFSKKGPKCISIGCSVPRPDVNNTHYKLSFDPPAVSFTCQQGYTTIGTISSSTCVPGHPWSAVDKMCKRPVNGAWSGWGTVSACFDECGLNMAKSRRSCTNPSPKYKGRNCLGVSVSTVCCNSNDTFTDYIYLVAQGQVSMSSTYNSNMVYYWLNSNSSWSAWKNNHWQWIQVVFESEKYVKGIVTKGRKSIRQWVSSFNLLYLNASGTDWILHPETFEGNTDSETEVFNDFCPVLKTTGIRINPQKWHSHISLRFDVTGCEL